MDSKTKVAGPLAAAGAVSLGLVFIGACGIGQDDTYVPPPPIHSGPQAVEQARYADPTATSVAQVVIPPSPSWRMAPEAPPPRTLPPEYQISVTSSAPSSTGPGESSETDETTRRPTLSATPSSAPTSDPDSATTSLPAPEIEPAHSESPIPVPGIGAEAGPPDSATPPVSRTTPELPVAPGPAAEPTAPRREQFDPGTEPARTTMPPGSPTTESEQPAPYGFPWTTTETTAPETTPPGATTVPTSTIVPTVPPGYGG
ncbi:hypothetical protein [Nocardia sp. NPDC019395]|uniref:hypothetical protein n=1 Tax=Nocardia sp. NPDC019395 TaxID=3154686 RepID=UPI0033CD164D